MGSLSLDAQVKKGSILLNKIVSFQDSVEIKLVAADDEEKETVEEVISEKDFLLPRNKDGMSRHDDKTRRKVQWNDSKGHSIVQVMEFDPSDESDSDEEDEHSCICSIM